MSKTIDFDEFRAERVQETVTIIIGGREYALPASLPATLALDILRMNKEGSEVTVSAEKLNEVGAGLFGGEAQWMQMLAEARVGMDELPDLIRLVMEAYNPGEATVSEEPTQD